MAAQERKLSVGIIMDPLNTIKIDKDTTFGLAMEAQVKGYSIWFIQMKDLMMKDSDPYAEMQQVEFRKEYPCYKMLGEKSVRPLDDLDVILMRQDPPLDDRFFYATHFLSFCKKAKVLNRPSSLREAPEKLYSLNFPGTFPPTLISSSATEIRKFMEEQGGKIIIKPLDGHGGEGIIYLHSEDQNFSSLLEMATQNGTLPTMAQKYLPEVTEGDKRVICVNGTARGTILRTPQKGEVRANIHAGGSVAFVELNERDQWLTSQIAEQLKKDGLYFVGLDIIGDYITEINVTSPTGIQEIQILGGINVAKMFWDELEL